MISVCSVIIALCSWISIPSVVPFTLQTFAVFFVIELLGAKRGTVSIVIYILLAAVGAPVLAGFKGGLGAVCGMTGGYIIGFIFIGLVCRIREALFDDRLVFRITAMITGLAICYAFGTAWFIVVYARQNGPITIAGALTLCVIPFIVPDMIKLTLAVMLSARLRRHLPV